MENLISVIVPIYNVQRYLEKCIKTIVNQTYKNLEIILIDDGSTDKSSDICDNWKQKDSRIKVIHKANEGLAKARNTGIEISTGKYLFFVDSDDYIELDIIENLYENIIQTSADISICGFYIETYEKMIPYCSSNEFVVNSEDALKKLFMHDNISIAIWNKLYKKELFEKIRFPNCRIHEELMTIYKLLDIANKISHISKTGYHYVQRQGSLLHSEFNNNPLYILEIGEEILEFIKSKYSNILEEAEIFFLGQLNKCILVSYKKKLRKEYKILKEKLKEYIPQILKNTKMKLKIKLKSILIAYFGFSRIYKK